MAGSIPLAHRPSQLVAHMVVDVHLESDKLYVILEDRKYWRDLYCTVLSVSLDRIPVAYTEL